MFTFIFWTMIGTFIGWNMEQPEFAKNFQMKIKTKVRELWDSKKEVE